MKKANNSKSSIWSKQHSLFKIVTVVTGIVTLFALDEQNNYLQYLVSFLYFSLESGILLKWIKVLHKMLVFFVAYLFCSFLFETDIVTQINFLGRISCLLLYSTYLCTISFSQFIQEGRILGKNRLIHSLQLYLVSIIAFIPLLQAEYKKNSALSGKTPGRMFNVLMLSLSAVMLQVPEIEIKVKQCLTEQIIDREFFTWSNLILMMFYTILILNSAW